MNEAMENNIDEIMSRNRRIETALYRISEHMGVERPNDVKAVVVVSPIEIHVRGYDVTLSKIKREMESANMFEYNRPISVMKDGVEIAVIAFRRE
jgi:hypothetical protein